MPVPQYTSVESVKLRLINKVQFQADPNVVADGELPDDLLSQIISDAETEVEQDLRTRYAIPFQSIKKKTFVGLPDHTQRALRTAIDQWCVYRILTTDFGRGTHVSADGYTTSLKEHYEAYITKLLGQDKEGASENHKRYRFAPPLDDLKLAVSNKYADDGYRGRLINTDASSNGPSDYAEQQINDPGQTFVGRRDGGLVGGG